MLTLKTDCLKNQVRGLVCHDRSKGCILKYFYPSSTQKVPEVCFRGEAYQYSSFWLSTLTKCVDAALAPLQLQGICILNYIDD